MIPRQPFLHHHAIPALFSFHVAYLLSVTNHRLEGHMHTVRSYADTYDSLYGAIPLQPICPPLTCLPTACLPTLHLPAHLPAHRMVIIYSGPPTSCTTPTMSNCHSSAHHAGGQSILGATPLLKKLCCWLTCYCLSLSMLPYLIVGTNDMEIWNIYLCPNSIWIPSCK